MATNGCGHAYAQTSRNPSPPPMTANEKESMSADHIGSTLFSKRFVLTQLLKLYKHEKEVMYVSVENDDSSEDKGEDQADSLKSTFENEVCELWDSSANAEVAIFIYENQGKEIFLDVIDKTTSPRLTEICFGILGNLVCVDDINEDCSRDSSFRSAMLGHLCITDALSLVELTRLLNVCFSNSETLSLWMNTMSNSSAMENIIAILQNSLNVQLLQHIIQLIDAIFDSDSDLMDRYANSTLFYAVRESYHVVRSKNQDLVPDLLYILQLVSTTESGVQQLAVDNSTFLLLNQCVHDQQNLFIEEKPSLLVSVYSVLGCLLYAKPVEVTKLVDENISILEYLIKILHHRIKEIVDSEDENELSYDSDSYVPVYLEVFHDICQIFCTRKENNFKNILECLKSRESHIKDLFERCNQDNIPLEWKKFLKNLAVLNRQHCILSFSIDFKF